MLQDEATDLRQLTYLYHNVGGITLLQAEDLFDFLDKSFCHFPATFPASNDEVLVEL